MRLIKMEDTDIERTKNEESQEPQPVSYNSIKTESNTLRDHNMGREVAKTTVESEELIPSQYINIQRVPDVVNSKSFLSNTSLLSGNELLVDINGDLISSGSISLERYIPHQYEDDLLNDELTEDDKRLAAALVAVQLVTQQKQQSGTHILPMLGSTTLPVTSKLVNINEQISVMPSLSGPNKHSVSGEQVIVNSTNLTNDKNPTALLQNYVQAEENTLPPLPPLKKVLSKSHYMKSSFNQNEEDHQAQLESLGLHTETEQIEISTEEIEIGPNEVIKTELNDFIIEEEPSIKTEVCEEQLSDDEQDSDGGLHDSDYENGGDKSKNSLPHKKRIPRKLKNPQKSPQNRNDDQQIQLIKINTYKCNKCSEFFTSANAFAAHKATHAKKQTGTNQSSSSSFSCELCFKSFTNQWKFFEHLKSHYEPIELDATSPKQTVPTSNKSNLNFTDSVLKKELKGNDMKIRSLQTSQSPNAKVTTAIPKTTTNSQVPVPQANSKWPVSTPGPQETGELTVTSSILYQQLTQSQGDQILWECEPCKKVFRRQKAYETHLSVAHPKQEEIEEFSEPEDMMEGIRVEVHSDDEKETNEKDNTTTETTPTVAPTVQKEWYREEDLHAAEVDIQEMEARTKTVYVGAHMCEMCNEAYHSKAALNQHISQQHAEIMTAITKTVRRAPNGNAKKGNLQCKECGRFFYYRNSFLYHLKSHIGERPHQCEVCGKRFFATSPLKVHMRQHSGVKPFKCEFCGRNFRQWGDLKYHCISIHSDQKNFQCEYCGKNFARKYSLTVHSRIHTGERNYKCEFCEKSFRASSYLQNHRRIHTGEKPHPCEVCGKPFRIRSDMKRHMVTHSREQYSAFVMKTKREPQTSTTTEDTKLIVQLDEQINQMSKVEELEVSTVESILPDEAVTASNRLQEELSVTYATERDPLETVAKETNTLYVWPVYTT